MTKPLDDGLKNCRLWSGDCEPSLVAIRAPPHTSWSTAHKLYSLQISLSDHRVLRTLMKIGLMKHVNLRSTALKNDDFTPVYVQPST
jgi:hypothetical protein